MNNDKTTKMLPDDELDAVSGGQGISTGCDKCSSAEFPKEGACFGAWSDGKLFSCGSLLKKGRFLKCVKCGFRKNN